MMHEVINDQAIPNFVPPLAGTEPLINIMDLDAYSTSQASVDGLRSAARFVPPAEHAQVLSPTFGSPAAYFEMQKQLASFIASHGGAIVVSDESTMVPEMQAESQVVAELKEISSSESAKNKNRNRSVNRIDRTRLERNNKLAPRTRFE
jgi:hypothetical protein